MAKDNKLPAKTPEKAPKRSRLATAAARSSKKGNRGGIKAYFKGVKTEMKKVVWPTKKELGSYTALVLVACAFFALAFWLIDTGFLTVLKELMGINL